MGAAVDYEQAGELKIGQVGIANLRIRTLDVDRRAHQRQVPVGRWGSGAATRGAPTQASSGRAPP